jgi:glycosyltransferase involved in cell wall biosynthesis
MTSYAGYASVSVVVPCYRCSDTLERAVNSILRQTLLPIELILVDDHSDDGGLTLSIISSLLAAIHDAKSLRVRELILHKNMGAAFARNAGWDVALGDYVAFLDADDAWHPRKLEIQYHHMLSNRNIDLSAHESVFNEDCITHPESNDDELWEPVKLLPLLFKNKISTRSVMLKRDCQLRFNPLMRYSEDYDLWLRVISSGGQVSYLNKQLAYIYRPEWSVGGLSGNLWAMQKGEIKAFFNVFRDKKTLFPIVLLAGLFSWLKFLRY